MLLRMYGLWRDMKFLSFGHYCEERLGMSGRSVEQRVALERRFYWLPDLRDAMASGRVSYEKARIIAANATEATLAAWLDRADRLTCIALAREAADQTDAQLCAAGAYDLRLPVRVAILLHDALRAARQASGRWITAEEALGIVSEHYLRTWREAARQRNTLQKRVLDRDRGWCQVPGCSHAAQQVHHVEYRSHGGADAPANLVSLCAAHHLHGIHAGYLRVTGRAPDRLRWRFRPGGGPWVVAAAR
jgi:5-methylcytosine-specific restriction endonuclease McrA